MVRGVRVYPAKPYGAGKLCRMGGGGGVVRLFFFRKKGGRYYTTLQYQVRGFVDSFELKELVGEIRMSRTVV